VVVVGADVVGADVVVADAAPVGASVGEGQRGEDTFAGQG
jgi:hypothetical protein